MADDLTKPLMGAGKPRKGLTPVGILLTLLAAALAGIAIWVIVVSDPSAPRDGEGDRITAAAEAGGGEVVIRTPEGQASGVVITTPGGVPVGANGPQVITLGGDPVVMTATPDPALIETGPYGLLPKIADSGVRPFDAYARPAPVLAGAAPRIAIIVGGIGINAAGSELALARLPGEISLALAPYGTGLASWAARARETGHELLLQLPLEPVDFPISDPGPHTLLVDDAAATNLDRLNWLMAQFTTYAGVISYAGGRFLGEPEAMAPVFDALAARGLMLVDDGAIRQSRSAEVATGILPFARADMVLDTNVEPGAIAAKLAELEALARERGYAVASASAFPVTIQAIAAWAEIALRQGVVLVPVTALANDPETDATTIRIE